MPVVTVERDDPRFPALRKGHNLRFRATGAGAASRIVLCTDAADCESVLQRIVSAGVRPTIRSGGTAIRTSSPTTPTKRWKAVSGLSHELFQSYARQVVRHPFVRKQQRVLKGMDRLLSLVQCTLQQANTIPVIAGVEIEVV